MSIKCNSCKRPKDPSCFGTYTRNGKKKHYKTCRVCQNAKARARHKRRMLKPKNRKKHNKRIRKSKKKKYHKNEEFREKCKQEARVTYLIDGEEIKAHARQRYRLDPEYREATKKRARRQHVRLKGNTVRLVSPSLPRRGQ